VVEKPGGKRYYCALAAGMVITVELPACIAEERLGRG
jgi:hypothetical protein